MQLKAKAKKLFKLNMQQGTFSTLYIHCARHILMAYASIILLFVVVYSVSIYPLSITTYPYFLFLFMSSSYCSTCALELSEDRMFPSAV